MRYFLAYFVLITALIYLIITPSTPPPAPMKPRIIAIETVSVYAEVDKFNQQCQALVARGYQPYKRLVVTQPGSGNALRTQTFVKYEQQP